MAQVADDSISKLQVLRWEFLDSMHEVHGVANLDSSFHYLQLMDDLADTRPDSSWHERVLRRKAKLYYRADKFLEAIPAFRGLFAYYEPGKYDLRKSFVHRRLAIALRKTGYVDSSLVHHQLAIDFARNAVPKKRFYLAHAYNSRGNAFINLQEFELAEKDYLRALPIYDSLNRRDGIAGVYNNLALIYSRTEQYDQAIPYLQKSLTLKTEDGDQRGMANTLANLGDVAFAQKITQRHKITTGSLLKLGIP